MRAREMEREMERVRARVRARVRGRGRGRGRGGVGVAVAHRAAAKTVLVTRTHGGWRLDPNRKVDRAAVGRPGRRGVAGEGVWGEAAGGGSS